VAFDPTGNIVQSVDANGNATGYQYNKDNELIATLDPNGHQVETVYDKDGRAVAQYDAIQNGSFSGYNQAGQATGSGKATSSSTTQVYNALGAVTQVTDPDGNITRTLYNLDGDTVGTIDPLGNASFTVYNADNQPTQQVDRDGRVINNTYDAGGRLTSQVWLAANGSQADNLTYTYDHADNLTAAANSYGSYTFTLDAANRPTQQVDPFNLTLNFTEDANGNVTQITDSTGGTETSIYNGDNELTSRRLSGGPNSAQLRMDLTYTADGQVSLLSRYADTAGNTLLGKTQNSYDPAGNLTEEKHTNGSNTVLEDFTYQYDAANRLSSETDTISGTPTTTNYSYDTSNQLTAAGSNSYSFDANGNRTMTGYQVGPDNEITSDGVWNYQYDPQGNEVGKTGVSGGPDAGISWVYGYNNSNQLTSATEYSSGVQQVQVSLFYDVFGNEVEEDVTQSGTTTVTKYAFNVLSGQGNSWADLNSSNQVQIRREYLDAVNTVFARIGSDGTEAWYLSDHLGSVRGLMNNSGSLIDTITYDAWGKISNESGPTTGDRFKFAGGQWDANISEYHFDARWYDPATGRWSSADPLGLLPDSNPYRYVGNNATNTTDRAGLYPSIFKCAHSPEIVAKLQGTPGGLRVKHVKVPKPYENLIIDDTSPQRPAVVAVTDYTSSADADYYKNYNPTKHHLTEDVDSPKDLAKRALKGLKNIQCLIISGHGTSTGGVNASVKKIDYRMTKAEARTITAHMAPKGYIVLASCDSGQSPNKLQKMANLLQRRVYGCTTGCVRNLDTSYDGKWVWKDPE
jgi:RHS repeat-associated protein